MHIVIPLLILLIGLVIWFRKHTKGPGGVRTGDLPKAAAKLGFLPADRLDTDHVRAPDPRVTAVREAVRAGNWQAGADWLAEAGRDWEERDRRADVLASEAVQDDSWLLAWRTARPEDPGAALVHAESLIDLAWEIRGGGYAQYTTGEQFAGFHRVLEQAAEACAHAQSLAGDDPCPFIAELPLAMGQGYPHDRFEKLWAQIVERDPHHLAAHSAALQYWCAKWCGSHQLAEAFARSAAEKGQPGRLLTMLPLRAYFEYEIAHDDLNRDEFYKRPEVVEAVDAALVDVAAAAAANPDDRRLPQVRHLLASLLFWQDRHEAAVEQFRLVDGYINAVPWSYRGSREGMIKAYTGERDYSAAQVLKSRGGI
jgi:hypothetical protein